MNGAGLYRQVGGVAVIAGMERRRYDRRTRVFPPVRWTIGRRRPTSTSDSANTPFQQSIGQRQQLDTAIGPTLAYCAQCLAPRVAGGRVRRIAASRSSMVRHESRGQCAYQHVVMEHPKHSTVFQGRGHLTESCTTERRARNKPEHDLYIEVTAPPTFSLIQAPQSVAASG